MRYPELDGGIQPSAVGTRLPAADDLVHENVHARSDWQDNGLIPVRHGRPHEACRAAVRAAKRNRTRYRESMADIVRVGRKGELTLPRRVRAAFNLKEGDELEVTVQDESIVLQRRARRLSAFLERLSGGGR